MSLIHEIHQQRPAVRYTLFALSMIIVISVVGYFGISSIQRNAFLAIHADEQERADFLAQQEARAPKPFVALARIAGSLTAQIGSLLGWEPDAGFDRTENQDNNRGGVYLLPLSQ